MLLPASQFEVEIAYTYKSSGIPITGTRYKQYTLASLKEIIQTARITQPKVKIKPIIKWIFDDALNEFSKEAVKAATRKEIRVLKKITVVDLRSQHV